jgi:ligand-binding sensor domain-containing protein
MAADSTGAVWLGAQNALYKVVNNDWTVYDQTFVLASRFPSGAFKGLAVAKDGTLWLGSDKGEICHFDPVKVQCLEFFAGIQGMAVGALTSLSLGPDGNVYFATAGGGISMYDGQQWRTFALPNERLAGNQVRDLIQDRAGQIWVASEAGIQQLAPAGETTAKLFTAEKDNLSTSETEVLHPAPKAGIWLGAVGASYFNGSTWVNYTSADGLAGNLVQAIATDSQGRTWFGTEFGLSIWNGSAFFNLNRENGLPSDNISALVADGDTMWIGTKGGGLLRFEKNQIRLFDAAKVGLPSDTVTALAQATDGALLVGTRSGLATFRAGAATPVPSLAGLVITAIAAGTNGQIWVGTQDDGLFYFDGKAWGQPPGDVKPPAQYITAILVDQQGSVWVGARSGGVIRYTP